MNENRRDFFKTAGAGLSAAAGAMLIPGAAEAAVPQWTEKDKLLRIASCSWPIRSIFKTRAGGRGGAGRGDAPPAATAAPGAAAPGTAAATPAGGRGGGGQGGGGTTAAQMKAKYGEITMLDFPQFTKDTFPGVTRMDIFSGLFGDVTDDSMFPDGRGFDPMSASGRKWLDQLANKLVTTGTKVQHISNNAPTNLASPDDALRKAGVEIAKRWLEGCKVLGVKSMRMNSPQALGPSIRPNALTSQEQQAKGMKGDGYVRNFEIVPLLDKAIESYKEMADFGGNLGIKVTFENHWGLAADPMNIRIMLDTINHPYCEASPDFCNWEHEYMLFNGLKALAPYSHTNVHAKYWDRWGDKNDVQRSVRVMLAGGFKGTFALEYEAGLLNGIEGAKYLYHEVLAALSTPVPAV
jgi:sugar phosphate isomerase/epimerase